MGDLSDFVPPERTGSREAQAVEDALGEWLAVRLQGENWGRTFGGTSSDLCSALDALTRREGSGE